MKVTKAKDTLSCAEALHRCPARLRPEANVRKLAALRATQTTGRLFRFRPPLLGAAFKGPSTDVASAGRACIQSRYMATETHSGGGCPAHCAGTSSCLRTAKAVRVLDASRCREHRSIAPRGGAGPSRSGVVGCDPRRGEPYESQPRARAERRRSHPGYAGKALLLASYGKAQPASCRVSFPLLPFVWTSKRKGVAQQRETSV